MTQAGGEATMATATFWCVGVTLPMAMCPMSLSKNGRAHWRVRHRAFQDQKTYALFSLPFTSAAPAIGMPWPAAVMHITWHYARGRAPDSDNIVARCAGVRDAFETAGIVADDQHISIGRVLAVKVPVGEECVTVTLERVDDYRAARGCAPPPPGAELPEVAIRRMRDGEDQTR